jgi:integrase
MKTIKVNLREKLLVSGKKSLYLDFYPSIPKNGKTTRREFLGLYLIVKPRTDSDRRINKETKGLAENIRANRLLAIQSNDYGFLQPVKECKPIDFLKFFLGLAETRNDKNKGCWISAYKYLASFCKNTLDVSQVTEPFLNQFRTFITNQDISVNTQAMYLQKILCGVREAVKDGLIADDITANVRKINGIESQREYLTFEELERLFKTDCVLPVLKSAALFSALTGLRWSDIMRLTWGQIQFSEKTGCVLRFTQQKTKRTETLPIPVKAVALLGEKQPLNNLIFNDLTYSTYTNVKLRDWLLNAGIHKQITFHCFRHTFATLQLSNGTDIYTVSKLLGHKDLKTTQLYAKVVDKKKTDAANLMDSLF